LSEAFGDQLDLVLIDKAPGFTFGFAKLDVMFGRTVEDQVVHSYSAIGKPGVRFVSAEVTAIDALAKRVETSAGAFEADVLVIALGANLDPSATPGLVEFGHEFYTNRGAFDLAPMLASFEGGDVVVGVTSTPFKCPPAPSEAALLVHDLLAERGLRDRSTITLVMPFGVPIPPSPDASAAVLAALAERDIRWHPEAVVREVRTREIALSDDTTLSCDLLLAVPKHVAPPVVVEAGLTVDGWIAVDPLTLQTSFDGVYAVGDVTSVGTPKAGVFSEGQAAIVAERLIAQFRDEVPSAEYDGHGLCYLELGHEQVAKVDVTFMSGQRPTGSLVGPSRELVADKSEFGTSRITRWFGAS
jgi:sulfide:quinone oxidoreductase